MTAPFKCPDCGIWWAGLEHRCKWYELYLTLPQPPYVPPVALNSTSAPTWDSEVLPIIDIDPNYVVTTEGGTTRIMFSSELAVSG